MRSIYLSVIDYFKRVNISLLLFLIFIINVKTPVKIAALIIFLIANRRMFLEKKIFQRFTWFYFSMIAITLVNLVLSLWSVSANYIIVAFTGILFWLISAGAAFLAIWFIEKTDTAKLHHTIAVFFILNAAISVGQLVVIMWDSQSFNPFSYQGMYQKYFVSTGDYIKGLSFAVSTTNAILNAFGLVYFLSRNKMPLVLLCMSILLLTASNFTNVLLFLVFMLIFIFFSNRNQKSIVIASLALLAVFIIKISPQNNTYITDRYKKVSGKPIKKSLPENLSPLKYKPNNILTPQE